VFGFNEMYRNNPSGIASFIATEEKELIHGAVPTKEL